VVTGEQASGEKCQKVPHLIVLQTIHSIRAAKCKAMSAGVALFNDGAPLP
jgi:hypothetical protein